MNGRVVYITFSVIVVVLLVVGGLFDLTEGSSINDSLTNNTEELITNNSNDHSQSRSGPTINSIIDNIDNRSPRPVLHYFGECVSIEPDVDYMQEFVYRMNGSRSDLFINIPPNSLLSGKMCLEFVHKYRPFNEEVLPLPPTKQVLHALTLFKLNLTLVNISSIIDEELVYNRTIMKFALVSDTPTIYPIDPYSVKIFIMNNQRFEFMDGSKDERTDRFECFIPFAYKITSRLLGVFAFTGLVDAQFDKFTPVTYPMKLIYRPVNEIRSFMIGYSNSDFYPPSTPLEMTPNVRVGVIQEIFTPIQLNLVPLARYSLTTSTFFPNMTSLAHVFEFKTSSDFFVTQDYKLVEVDRRSMHCLYIYKQKVIAKEGVYTKSAGKPRLICKPILKNDISQYELLVLVRVKNPPHPSDDVKIHTLKNNHRYEQKLAENSKVTFKFTISGRSQVRIDTKLDKVNDPFSPPPTFYFGMGFVPDNVNFDNQMVGQNHKYFYNDFDISIDLFIIAYSPADHVISITASETSLPMPDPIDSHSTVGFDEDNIELIILVSSAIALLIAVILVCLGTIVGVAFFIKKTDNRDETTSLLGKENKIV